MESTGIQRDVLKGVFADRQRSFTLRMAPMIDMIFLLLIFFLVAAKWRPKEDFLPFQLPVAQAQTRQLGQPEPLIIQILATQTGCEVRLGESNTIPISDRSIEPDLTTLMVKMRDCLLARKRFASDPIEITCGEKVKWEHLAKIYNVFYGAGLTNITFQMTE